MGNYGEYCRKIKEAQVTKALLARIWECEGMASAGQQGQAVQKGRFIGASPAWRNNKKRQGRLPWRLLGWILLIQKRNGDFAFLYACFPFDIGPGDGFPHDGYALGNLRQKISIVVIQIHLYDYLPPICNYPWSIAALWFLGVVIYTFSNNRSLRSAS